MFSLSLSVLESCISVMCGICSGSCSYEEGVYIEIHQGNRFLHPCDYGVCTIALCGDIFDCYISLATLEGIMEGVEIMNKVITLIVVILLLIGAVGYVVNHFTEVANAKKVQKLMDAHEQQIRELGYKENILVHEAYEAGRLAGMSKSRAIAKKKEREALKAPQSAEETIERLHRLGFTSARILR